MTVQEALDKIKAIAFNLAPEPVAPAPVVEPVALGTEYKTVDGLVLSIDKLEEGGSVMIDGQPAPDGDLTLEDGTLLSVSGGLIAVITPGAPVAEDPAQMQKQFAEEFQAFKDEFNTHKNAFNQIQTDFAAAKETITKQDEAIKGLLEVVQSLGQVAVAQPTQAPSNFEKSYEEMTALERYRYDKKNK